jgi:hypothetical protein
MDVQEFFDRPQNKMTPCQNILGSDAAVRAFCDFWAENEKEIGKLGAVKLYKYTNDHNFTKEELVAFKLGLVSALGFFKDCWIEVNNKPEDTKK